MKTKDRGARKRAKLSKMHNAATKKISRTTITGPIEQHQRKQCTLFKC